MTVQLSAEVFHVDGVNINSSEDSNFKTDFMSGVKGWRFSIPKNVAIELLKGLQEYVKDVH